MGKLIFGLSSILSLILLIKISGILFKDFNRLTEYGMGYLVGLIVLFLISGIISFLTGRKIIKKAHNNLV